jgi:phage shock protein C
MTSSLVLGHYRTVSRSRLKDNNKYNVLNYYLFIEIATNIKSDKMKRLYRSKKNRLIAGVLGGIAEYFNVNATLLRLIFLLPALLFGGWLVIGIVPYIVAYIIIPKEPESFPKK